MIINISWTKDVLDFLHRDSYQEKIASKTASIGYAWSDLPWYVQSFLNLLGGDYGLMKKWQRGGILVVPN